MVFLNPETGEQMFRHASGSDWIGPLQAVFAGRECVPMMVDGVKFFVEFSAPPYARGIGVFEDMLFKCKDGTVFYPRLEYRIITIWFDDTASEQRMKPLCDLHWFRSEVNHQRFVATLRRTFLSYHEACPHVGQYFFQANEDIARFLLSQVLEDGNVQVPGRKVSLLPDIAPPYYGFVFNVNKES